MSNHKIPRPTPEQLATMRKLGGMSVQAIADLFGASGSTVRRWIEDDEVQRGIRAPARAEARAAAKSKSEIAALAEEMLDKAINTVRTAQPAGNTRDEIALAKLALDVHSVLIERVASAPKDAPKLGREELVARVRRATQGAAARHLRVVGET